MAAKTANTTLREESTATAGSEAALKQKEEAQLLSASIIKIGPATPPPPQTCIPPLSPECSPVPDAKVAADTSGFADTMWRRQSNSAPATASPRQTAATAVVDIESLNHTLTEAIVKLAANGDAAATSRTLSSLKVKGPTFAEAIVKQHSELEKNEKRRTCNTNTTNNNNSMLEKNASFEGSCREGRNLQTPENKATETRGLAPQPPPLLLPPPTSEINRPHEQRQESCIPPALRDGALAVPATVSPIASPSPTAAIAAIHHHQPLRPSQPRPLLPPLYRRLPSVCLLPCYRPQPRPHRRAPRPLLVVLAAVVVGSAASRSSTWRSNSDICSR